MASSAVIMKLPLPRVPRSQVNIHSLGSSPNCHISEKIKMEDTLNPSVLSPDLLQNERKLLCAEKHDFQAPANWNRVSFWDTLAILILTTFLEWREYFPYHKDKISLIRNGFSVDSLARLFNSIRIGAGNLEGHIKRGNILKSFLLWMSILCFSGHHIQCIHRQNQ